MSALEKIVVLKLNDKKERNPVLPKEFKDEVANRLGSEFKFGTRDCIRGLNPVQERILLPPIIGLQPQDASFPHKTREYWADFSVFPTAAGRYLNVATTEVEAVVGGEKITYDNPVVPEDYMIYQIARQSSKVASTPEQLQYPGEYDFLLIDLSEMKAKEEETYKTKKNATLAFAKLVTDADSNRDRIDWVIQMLKEQEEFFNFRSSMADKEMFLDKKLSENPEKFLKVVKDPNLEIKALLRNAIYLGEISLEGDYYFLGETNIGPAKAAVDWLKSSENSAKVIALKSRMETKISNQKQ